MPRVSEVFVAGGEPKLTYNPRSNLFLEDSIRSYLDDRYQLLSVSGPTKFGKTVLVKRIIPNTAGIWVSGGQIETINQLWEHVLEQLGGHTSLTDEKSAAQSTTSGREMRASIMPTGVGGEIKSQHATKSETGTRSVASRSVSSSVTALRRLSEEMMPLIIDDFHYIAQDVQLRIVRSLKDPIFSGLPVIVISVPHRAFDAVRVEKEMTGRVQILTIPDWSEQDLATIAEKGFSALNVFVEAQTISRLAKESFGSPHLMQEFCKRLCKQNGVEETKPSITRLNEPDDWSDFFRSVASQASKQAFDRLAAGPRQRSDRLDRRLRNGDSCDIYTAILIAIAETGPLTEMSYEELRTAVKSVLDDTPPQAHEVTRILEKMSEIAREKIEGEPVLEWNKEESKLYISDPFFAYYLRWGVRLPKQ